MMMIDEIANVTCRVKSREENPFNEPPASPKLVKSSYVLAYGGDLEGEGILEELKVQFPGDCAVFYRLQRITGKLGEFSGSFIVKHTGRTVNGVLSAKQTVVPGSGTGGFKGLRGEMTLQSFSDKEFSIKFNYRFA